MPRIYVACLAAYVAGTLHGKWIDVPIDTETLTKEIQSILASSPVQPSEEYAIHDYDDMSSAFGEYPALSDLTAYAKAVEGESEEWREAYDSLIGEYSVSEAVTRMADDYMGCFKTFREYADEVADDGMSVDTPEFMTRYFDYEAFARDLKYDYTTEETSNGCHVWSN